MNKRELRFWIVGGFVLLIGALLAGALGIQGHLPWQKGDLYADPQGRFTVVLSPEWEQVKTDGPYLQFHLADPPFTIYLLALETNATEDAFSQAIEVVGLDPALLTGGAMARIEEWQVYKKEDFAGLEHGLASQIVGGNAYVLVVTAEKTGVSVENSAIYHVMSSLKIAGKQEIVIKSYADLETFVQQQVDSQTGSISVAVLHGDEVVYTYVYGEANPINGIQADTQTIYRFGSMTKPVTATALMQLVEQGRVDLDAWAGEYVPEFPEYWKVTVRQLLDHSACMQDSLRLTDALIAKPGESFAPLEEIFIQYAKDYPELACEPGKVSQYSNGHYLALARIIEQVSGEPYETHVVNQVLIPLKMDSTRFQVVEADERYAKGQWPSDQTDELVAQLNELRGPGQEDLILQHGEAYSTVDDFRILPPWGGLFGTPSDVTHFLQMYLNSGRFGNNQILQPKTIAAMEEMQSSTDGTPLGFGLSWMIGEDDFGRYYWHSGSGHTIESTMRFYRNLDLGVVVMSNFNGSQTEEIAEGLVSAWMNEK
jgi:CubicO group peptidase (beta-lactamase class C family)